MSDATTPGLGDPDEGAPVGEPEPGGWMRVILAELGLVALIFAGVGLLLRGASGPDAGDAFAAPQPASVSLADLPSAMADTYRYAADHAQSFTAIPCFCGCQQTLGHRNIEDCFVTPGGAWDAHASGCGVCTAEAVAVKELLDTNTPIETVRQRIVDQFGPPHTASQETAR